jgi:hypothetical protein
MMCIVGCAVLVLVLFIPRKPHVNTMMDASHTCRSTTLINVCITDGTEVARNCGAFIVDTMKPHIRNGSGGNC